MRGGNGAKVWCGKVGEGGGKANGCERSFVWVTAFVSDWVSRCHADVRIADSILKLEAGQECVLIGTLYKHMQLKPSALAEYAQEVCLPPSLV